MTYVTAEEIKWFGREGELHGFSEGIRLFRNDKKSSPCQYWQGLLR
jgi:hypothetical protein